MLWTEPIKVVVPADHELARESTPLAVDRLVGYPLVISGNWSSGGGALVMVSAYGIELQRRVGVDAPATLVEMVRLRLGVGVLTAVTLEQSDTSGLIALDIGDARMNVEVAAFGPTRCRPPRSDEHCTRSCSMRRFRGGVATRITRLTGVGAIVAGCTTWQPR